ncbi:hypothetical protein IFM89_026737 [Coptis chinensis]|uniref:Uncharacterized protein n=1 Tax=Coptis chinensis TaxID=261450 RepID=A0A835M6R1_9MAGN|nr:hypothetical protein IFM89_026737 [Coptis chinensis]
MGGADVEVYRAPKICQLCEQQGHKAPSCPYLNRRCKEPRCNGIMEIIKRGNDEGNLDIMFLKCDRPFVVAHLGEPAVAHLGELVVAHVVELAAAYLVELVVAHLVEPATAHMVELAAAHLEELPRNCLVVLYLK